MRYLDPPKEYGISVNFGTSDVGSGNVQPMEALKPVTQESEIEPVEEVKEEVVEEEIEASEPTSEASEEVITQQNEESIAIKKREADKQAKIDAENIKRENERKEAERIETERKQKIEAENRRKEQERQEKAAKKKKLDDLLGGIGNTDGKADGGEGDDNQAGDKGQPTGDPNASGYYGNGGSGSGGNYRLGNRKAISMPKPTYDCNEEGKVFVSISVDNSGNVISAQPGVKGTTNSANCLLERAKEAALKTKFNSDTNAPSKQVGTIIYNFSLSN